jgi:DNA-binding LacI/PurR family transcriptional regulator
VSFALSPDGREDVADLGRQEEAGFRVSRLRLRGDRGAAEVPVYECPGSIRAVGYRVARTLLSLKRKLTAIPSSSDQLALGVLAAVEELGLSVPENHSVVGSDDIPPSAVQFG